MNLQTLQQHIQKGALPKGCSVHLQALWHDAQGDWEAAHRTIQDEEGILAAHIHAYLHRKEGDAGNAAYWYRRAGVAPGRGTLQQEWETLASICLQQQ